MLEYLARARRRPRPDGDPRPRAGRDERAGPGARRVSSETEARAHPLEGEWSIAQVVDHIAQTQIRAADELRHLLSGRRPPAPPVYEALTSGAALWAPWAELLDGLCSANDEMEAQLAATTGAEAARVTGSTATARTILLANRRAPDGRVAPGDLRRRAGLEGVRAGAAPAPARPPHAGQEPPCSSPRTRRQGRAFAASAAGLGSAEPRVMDHEARRTHLEVGDEALALVPLSLPRRIGSVMVDGLKFRSRSTQPATAGQSAPFSRQRPVRSTERSTSIDAVPMKPATRPDTVRHPPSQWTA